VDRCGRWGHARRGERTLLNMIPDGGGGGNILGTILGSVSSLFGGQAGDVVKTVSALGNAGVKTEQIPPFVETFIGEAKKIAGNDTVDKVLASVPVLANLGK
jgi:hypothetical protein